ncbi:MerR family transcriptional regulator [Streptomyces pyxinae]|uniref:MerR family transcriptional regulator n=1 Tax=Streptomyces pyxinae TaxID=2970734 RepID=UPI002867C3E7|nr:MerR family transcriptional regulator [Streptomyces sp. LP05-1]
MAPPGTTTGLTTGAVALRLGVAPTTLRTWERRYGLGPRDRDPGRHRRWGPADVAVLEHMCRLTAEGVAPAEAARAARAAAATTPRAPVPAPVLLPALPAPAAPPPGEDARPADPGRLRHGVRGLARAAVRLDAPRVEALLAGAVARYGPADTWEQLMVPALRAIGRRWAAADDLTSDRYIEAEHLLSWHVSTALRRAPARPVAEGRPVLLGCAPGEQHTLPLEALAAALTAHGMPLRMFGAAVPAGTLASAVRRTGPRAVVLWSQTRPTADRTVAALVRASVWGIRGARVAPTLLIAGPGWARVRLPEGAHRPAGLREALALLGVPAR